MWKQQCEPSLMTAFRYGNRDRTLRSGMALRSGMTCSISAWSFKRTSGRRLSSHKKYDRVVEVVSTPAILHCVVSQGKMMDKEFYVQVTHAFRDDVPVGHDFIGRKEPVLKETLQERHLFRVEVAIVLSSLHFGSHVIEPGTDILYAPS